MRVEVYRNLRNGLMSVREAHKRVLTHEERVFIRNPEFVVGQKGRERVLATGHKNVHAFVRGELMGFDRGNLTGFDDYPAWKQATYNPKIYTSFVDVDTKCPLSKATKAVVTTQGVFYCV